jgi:hypothetical protein
MDFKKFYNESQLINAITNGVPALLGYPVDISTQALKAFVSPIKGLVNAYQGKDLWKLYSGLEQGLRSLVNLPKDMLAGAADRSEQNPAFTSKWWQSVKTAHETYNPAQLLQVQQLIQNRINPFLNAIKIVIDENPKEKELLKKEMLSNLYRILASYDPRQASYVTNYFKSKLESL